jgi:hypothetical protein
MPRPLSASDLLELWERGAGRSPVEQGLLLLQAAYPDLPACDLPRLTIGKRDAALMRLREQTFGLPLNGLAVCPVCAERVEIGLPLEELLAIHAGYDDPPALTAEAESNRLSIAGYDLTFRLPDSADLMNASTPSAGGKTVADPDSARLALLEACLLEARHNGQLVRAADLPEAAIDALTARMDEADPLANVTLPLTCPACGHSWEVLLDIVSFFWAEIGPWAERLLREVHALASAYGWREADILSLSAARRQKYLELVGA